MRTTTKISPPKDNPLHPGELLKESFGPEGLHISIAEAARNLGIARVSLSRVVNGHAAVSPDLALRLERAGISTARFWMAAQAAFDLAEARKRKQPNVIRLYAPEAA